MPELITLSPSLHTIKDTCNVYALVDDDAALVIDAGSGLVVDTLTQLGVDRIEWVLHTHHHRDQCWGTPRLQEQGAKVAVPEYERHLFEDVEVYWQTRRVFDNYNNRNTFFTIGESMAVDASLEDYETFNWRQYQFYVLPAKGHTFGSAALIATIDGKRVAFTGDLMAPAGKLVNLHSMEYMYGGMQGLIFTLQSLHALRKQHVDLVLPSHGGPVIDVERDIDRLEQRIMDCVSLGRGMMVGGWDGPPETYFLPKMQLHAISEHLLWGGVWTCSNFYVILSSSGKALFIDYGQASMAHLHVGADHEGMETMRFIEHRLDDLEARFGVSSVDVVIPTHIHDDHTCGIPYLQRHHGTECWALDDVADVIEDPSAWASTPCLFPKAIRVDRRLTDGERFRWEEFEFQIRYAPGQTEFHSVIATVIDGRMVAFTGDNYFMGEVVRENRVETRPHVVTVFRNSFQLAMHRRCAEVMRALSPELICPGHGEYSVCSKEDIDTYADYVSRKERAFRELVHDPADHYIDLFWGRLLPYVATVEPGGILEYKLLLRNNLERPATYQARLLPPPGWSASGELETLELDADGRGSIRLVARAPARRDGRRRLMTAEILIDGQSEGPLCEALVACVGAGGPRPRGDSESP